MTHVKTIRILLADDHTVVRKGLRLLLESQPASRWWPTPRTAARRSRWPRSIRPDVVVMDVAMPVLNGIEAARQISAQAAADRGRVPEHALRRGLRAEGAEGGRARLPAEGLGGARPDQRGEGGERGQGVLQPGDQQDAGGGLHARRCRSARWRTATNC